MTLGERIKKLRRELNLTQQEFAGRIGSTQNALTGYETGRRNPSRSVINNICKTFRVNEDWLKTGTGEMFRQISRISQIEEFVNNVFVQKPLSFQMRFLTMLCDLSESDWKVLERMAYTIIEERDSAAPAPAEQEKPADDPG